MAETDASSPIAWLTPTARRPPAQRPNKCSQPERDTGVFTGLCNQLVEVEERKWQERWKKSLPGHTLPHLLVKRIVTTLFTNKDVKALFMPWVLHIDIRGEKVKKKSWDFVFFLLYLTECHQRTMTCNSGRWRHCWHGLRRFYSLQIIPPKRYPGHVQMLHGPIFKTLVQNFLR